MPRSWRGFALAALCLLVIAPAALAIDSEPPLPTPALQKRYERLTHQFRCLVCQNESIADSSASLAADFRKIVHDQLLAGRSDAQIRDYLVARYGDYILLDPPVAPRTWLLWGGPFAVVVLGALLVLWIVRRRSRLPDADTPLTDNDSD
ncbi:MAG: cytochrome c-type biogenesis protein CcmH [Gammaproteobacteria bacterium]|nr:cytochrome c-type biogenesis protein CcmH [Gammaproteobacteria bacterium]